MSDIIRLLRPAQYLKNLFVFLPLFFAGRLTDPYPAGRAIVAFFVFCSIASSVYIFNDLCDVTADRLHPTKKNRPIPAGRVSRSAAVTCAVLLQLAGLLASFLFERSILYLCVIYTLMNAAYTVRLKHIPVLDIFVIACGFVIRIYAGGTAAGVPISSWIILMTFLLALFIALGKRRNDVLIFNGAEVRTRKAIDGYNISFIDSSMMAMAAVTIVCYIMYTKSPDVMEKFHTDKLYLTSFFVILGMLRYMQVALVGDGAGSPTDVLLKDRFIQCILVAWLVAFGVIIY